MENQNLKSNLISLYGRKYNKWGSSSLSTNIRRTVQLDSDFLRIETPITEDSTVLLKQSSPVGYLYIKYRMKDKLSSTFNIRRKVSKTKNFIYTYGSRFDPLLLKEHEYTWEHCPIEEIGFSHVYRITQNIESRTIPVTILGNMIYIDDKVLAPAFYKVTQEGIKIIELLNARFGTITPILHTDLISYIPGIWYEFKD